MEFFVIHLHSPEENNLVLKDKDLEFLTSVLIDNENDEELIKEEISGNETEYSRRKKAIKEKEMKNRESLEERQISIFRSIMTPDASSLDTPSSSSLNNSLIAKNYATSETEKAKTVTLDVERITSQLTHPQRDQIYNAEDVALLKLKLKKLMQL